MWPAAPANSPPRLNFTESTLLPLPERMPQGNMTAHFLVFVDPRARRMCPVPCGRYTSDSICTMLEQNMTNMARHYTPRSFSIVFRANRFIFIAKYASDDRVVPANFSLVFNHPSQFDPERIGFAPLMYSGRASYASTSECVVANLATGASTPICPHNVYRMSEIPQQQRFKMFTAPLYNMTAVITEYDQTQALLTVNTYVGQLPFSNGLQDGDVVQIINSSQAKSLALTTGWVEKTVPPHYLARPITRTSPRRAAMHTFIDRYSACELTKDIWIDRTDHHHRHIRPSSRRFAGSFDSEAHLGNSPWRMEQR